MIKNSTRYITDWAVINGYERVVNRKIITRLQEKIHDSMPAFIQRVQEHPVEFPFIL